MKGLLEPSTVILWELKSLLEPSACDHCRVPLLLYLATKMRFEYVFVSVVLGGPKKVIVPVKSPVISTSLFPSSTIPVEVLNVPAPIMVNHCSTPLLLYLITKIAFCILE